MGSKNESSDDGRASDPKERERSRPPYIDKLERYETPLLQQPLSRHRGDPLHTDFPPREGYVTAGNSFRETPSRILDVSYYPSPRSFEVPPQDYRKPSWAMPVSPDNRHHQDRRQTALLNHYDEFDREFDEVLKVVSK